MFIDRDLDNIDILLQVQNAIEKIEAIEEVSGYKIQDLIYLFQNKKIIIDKH